MWAGVYTWVQHSHSATKKPALRFCASKAIAKNRGMVWTRIERKSETDSLRKEREKKTCLGLKQKTGDKGQKLCRCRASVLQFLSDLLKNKSLCRAAREKTDNFLHIPSFLHYMQNIPPAHLYGLLTFNPPKLILSAASALTCEVTQCWFELSFFVILTLNLSHPREMKQQAADSHPADSTALADGWSCHSLIILGGN